MSKFFRWDQPASDMTIEEYVLTAIVSGVVANKHVDGIMPPEVIVDWCTGVADELLNRRFGDRGGKFGAESIAEFEAKTGKSIQELVAEKLSEIETNED